MTATDENAKQIGKLQARVCELEGTVRAFTKTTAEAFEMVDDGETYRAMSHMDKLVEQQDRAVLADGSVPG